MVLFGLSLLCVDIIPPLCFHAVQLIGCEGPALASDDEKLYRMEKGLSREEADDLGCDVSA